MVGMTIGINNLSGMQDKKIRREKIWGQVIINRRIIYVNIEIPMNFEWRATKQELKVMREHGQSSRADCYKKNV